MMTAKRPDEAAFEAGFNKVAHDIPYERELQAMSYAQLSVLLASCVKGSPKYLVIEREIARRANAEDAKAAVVSTEKRWFARPIGMLVIGAAGSLIAWAVLRLFGIG
jgi:hypothetical protein